MIKIKQEQRCTYIKEDGEQCGSIKSLGSPFCIFHNPDPRAQEILKAGRLKGSMVPIKKYIPMNNSDFPYPKTANDLKKFFYQQFRKKLAGELNENQWQTTIEGTAALSKLMEISDITLGLLELEDELEAMQEKLNKGATDRGVTDEPGQD